jgi:hypothetical protein
MFQNEHNYSCENLLQMLTRPCGLLAYMWLLAWTYSHSLPTCCTKRIKWTTRAQDEHERVLPVLRMLHSLHAIFSRQVTTTPDISVL